MRSSKQLSKFNWKNEFKGSGMKDSGVRVFLKEIVEEIHLKKREINYLV
jgi:hypothetical protein